MTVSLAPSFVHSNFEPTVVVGEIGDQIHVPSDVTITLPFETESDSAEAEAYSLGHSMGFDGSALTYPSDRLPNTPEISRAWWEGTREGAAQRWDRHWYELGSHEARERMQSPEAPELPGRSMFTGDRQWGCFVRGFHDRVAAELAEWDQWMAELHDRDFEAWVAAREPELQDSDLYPIGCVS